MLRKDYVLKVAGLLLGSGGLVALAPLFRTTGAAPTTAVGANPQGISIGTVNGSVEIPAAPRATPTSGVDPAALRSLMESARLSGQTEERLAQTNRDLARLRQQAGEWRYLYFTVSVPRAIDMLRELAAYPQYHPSHDAFAQRWANLFSGSSMSSAQALTQVLVAGGWVRDTTDGLRIAPEGLRLLARFGQLPTVASSPAARIEASFDCSAARTWTERAICSNARLAAQDVELTQLYLSWRRLSSSTAVARDEQAAWRRNVRDTCTDIECLIAAYQARTADLQMRVAAGGKS